MKSIIAFFFLFLAVQAKPFAAPAKGSCHAFVPSKSNPVIEYSECDLDCVLVEQKDITCSFDITQVLSSEPSSAKLKIELVNYRVVNTTEPTATYLCVSTGVITLNDLPLKNRDQCVQCVNSEQKTNASIKCENLTSKTYNADSMFALEIHALNKPINMDSFHNGGFWKVPALQSRDAKLVRTEIQGNIDENGLYYHIHTQFDH